MIRALYGYSVIVVLCAAWWPITRFAWRQMQAEHIADCHDWPKHDTDDNVLLTLRGVSAAFIGVGVAIVLALFWPFIGLAWAVGHLVSVKMRGRAEREITDDPRTGLPTKRSS